MRARFWILPVALAAVFAAAVAVAEPIGPHWQFTPFGGYTIFDAKLRFPGSNRPLTDQLHVGGRLGYQTRHWLGLEAAAGFTPTTEDLVTNGQDYDWMHASGNLMVSPGRGRWGNPFAFVGGGWTQLKPAAGDKRSTGTIEFGAGLMMWMTDEVGLRLEARDVSFKPLETATGQTNFHNVVIGAGLTFALGAKPRDTDGDGVPDRKDKCPDTPKGATVDANGCPHDSDGDGVLDGLDKCPNTPKGCKVDANGCPIDSDGDGVCDGVDQCADTPRGATVDATGCPHDSDGDGVLDGLDKCPNTPKGCKVDENGCPIDSDGDGVCDGLDQCPDTPKGTAVDSVGCPVTPPEVQQRETELLNTGLIRLQDVKFETAKADILPESRHALDVVGEVLSKWPQLKIEIGGHCDSRGSAAYNLALSRRRVDSVRKYLLQGFPKLEATQFTTKGYGESRPLVPNTSPENMAQNRRVEFVVLNKEVLEQERQKRLPPPPPPAPPAPPGGAPPDTSQKK
jgi:outer membrane protein OmpA-like peptidoglycan-associated protein/opacity protein-like surface antigen